MVASDALHLVRVDSTGPHNRTLWAAHGEIDEPVLEEVDAALARAPAGRLVVLLLHHHPLPLPEESLPERLSTRLGWPYAAELRLGAALLEVVRGRCDLVLHGHRHLPREQRLWSGERRALGVYNAGCSTALGRFRVFTHAAGATLGAPEWWEGRRLAASA
jgi:3',5'-cyclic AMP phosphodiesterase CpdA